MTQAKFNLRSWASNSPQLQAITAVAEGRADHDVTVNLLGLLWNASNDTITFTPKQFFSNTDLQLFTKRVVLQMFSRVYDPLRFLSPVTIQAKILMQDL